MEGLLAKSTTIDGNMAALRCFYMEITEDQAWAFLMLEFKLFTIRHPKSKKRLQNLVAESLSP